VRGAYLAGHLELQCLREIEQRRECRVRGVDRRVVVAIVHDDRSQPLVLRLRDDGDRDALLALDRGNAGEPFAEPGQRHRYRERQRRTARQRGIHLVVGRNRRCTQRAIDVSDERRVLRGVARQYDRRAAARRTREGDRAARSRSREFDAGIRRGDRIGEGRVHGTLRRDVREQGDLGDHAEQAGGAGEQRTEADLAIRQQRACDSQRGAVGEHDTHLDDRGGRAELVERDVSADRRCVARAERQEPADLLDRVRDDDARRARLRDHDLVAVIDHDRRHRRHRDDQRAGRDDVTAEPRPVADGDDGYAVPSRPSQRGRDVRLGRGTNHRERRAVPAGAVGLQRIQVGDERICRQGNGQVGERRVRVELSHSHPPRVRAPHWGRALVND